MSEGPAFLLKMELEWEREGDGRGLSVVLISLLTAAPFPGVWGSFMFYSVTLSVN